MGLTHILDTNAGIYIVDNRLATPLPPGSFGISVVTEIELLSKPGMTAGEMATARAFLSKLGLVDLSPSIREEAARMRRDERLRLPDAMIVATALVEGAVLVTNDLALHRVPGLVILSLALKP